MTIDIRDARTDDEAAWRALWAQYLAFYDIDLPADVTDATWARIVDPGSAFFMRVADDGGTLSGFALCHVHEASWVKEPVCYLEDLFLTESARGKRIGQALMDDLVARCKTKGYARLYWHTDKDNHTARRLYDRYVETDGHIRYRISF